MPLDDHHAPEIDSRESIAPADETPLARFLRVRARTQALAAPLSPEDWMLQSMPDASPVKWNLAHTSWFFETFILLPYAHGYGVFDDRYAYLFNSYYNLVGKMHPRPQRGLVSRPSAADVLSYRLYVTEAVEALLASDALGGEARRKVESLLQVGIAHEEQHQELLLTDIKHAFYHSPFPEPVFPEPPAGIDRAIAPASSPTALGWVAFEGGLVDIGHNKEGHAFDNEGPHHRVHLTPYALADRPVTNGEFLAFVEAGGYGEPALWLADAWTKLCAENWRAPFYWRRTDGRWMEYGLDGFHPLDRDAPVCHLSYYEAAAYAEWTGFRLPSEFEWERAAAAAPLIGNFLGAPRPRASAGGVRQLFGDVWEWTASPYVAYPGYRTPKGAIGEYNGKFMSSQMVLRGGSCATPVGHIRPTYRNFFPPDARWQFAGLRLARDI